MKKEFQAFTYDQWLASLDKQTRKAMEIARQVEISKGYQRGEVRDYFVSVAWKEESADQGGRHQNADGEYETKDAPVVFAYMAPSGGVGFPSLAEAREYAMQEWLREGLRAWDEAEARGMTVSVLRRKRWQTYEPKTRKPTGRQKRDAELDAEFDKPTLMFGSIESVPDPGEPELDKKQAGKHLAAIRKLLEATNVNLKLRNPNIKVGRD